MSVERRSLEVPEHLPLLPIRDVVVFPHTFLPLFVALGLGLPENLIEIVDFKLAFEEA